MHGLPAHSNSHLGLGLHSTSWSLVRHDARKLTTRRRVENKRRRWPLRKSNSMWIETHLQRAAISSGRQSTIATLLIYLYWGLLDLLLRLMVHRCHLGASYLRKTLAWAGKTVDDGWLAVLAAGARRRAWGRNRRLRWALAQSQINLYGSLKSHVLASHVVQLGPRFWRLLHSWWVMLLNLKTLQIPWARLKW